MTKAKTKPSPKKVKTLNKTQRKKAYVEFLVKTTEAAKDLLPVAKTEEYSSKALEAASIIEGFCGADRTRVKKLAELLLEEPLPKSSTTLLEFPDEFHTWACFYWKTDQYEDTEMFIGFDAADNILSVSDAADLCIQNMTAQVDELRPATPGEIRKLVQNAFTTIDDFLARPLLNLPPISIS
ncbi:MAG: hypothetical protein ACXABY_11775 [Candidatus Thorarchaeota archaeon]|jgi:hypothetical protein